MDALRYSLNIPSVMMQYLVGVGRDRHSSPSRWGSPAPTTSWARIPGLTLTLGSVPVNLTNFTQAYGVFAQQGTLHPATAVIEIRDRDGKVIYDPDGERPGADRADDPRGGLPHPLDHGGQHQPGDQRAVGAARAAVRPRRAAPPRRLQDRNDQRLQGRLRHAATSPAAWSPACGWATTTRSRCRTSSGQGLYSADGPLYLWHDFMRSPSTSRGTGTARRRSRTTTSPQPAGRRHGDVCRFSGMAADRRLRADDQGAVPGRDGPAARQRARQQAGGGGALRRRMHPAMAAASGSGSCFDIVARSPSMAGDRRRWWPPRALGGPFVTASGPRELERDGDLGRDQSGCSSRRCAATAASARRSAARSEPRRRRRRPRSRREAVVPAARLATRSKCTPAPHARRAAWQAVPAATAR